MNRRDDLTHLTPEGDANDPQGFLALLEKFLEWQQVHNYADQTVANHRRFLGTFIAWAEQRGLTKPTEITKPILERYQRFLYHFRKRNGDPLSFFSQYTLLVPIRAFFKWLARQNYTLFNPASEIELPKLEHRLPRHILTAQEVEIVLNQPDLNDPIGIRDRAMLETFYSTGMRRTELIQLGVFDIDKARGTVTIRLGKGKKDRIIPIGERAVQWIDKYLHEVRPSLLIGDQAGDTLFLTPLGLPLEANRLSQMVANYVAAAQLGKKGSCHLLRHSMATLMLENGADIRFIQVMLGHAKLTTTQIYTQVSIQKLKAVHDATHPGKMQRNPDPEKEA